MVNIINLYPVNQHRKSLTDIAIFHDLSSYDSKHMSNDLSISNQYPDIVICTRYGFICTVLYSIRYRSIQYSILIYICFLPKNILKVYIAGKFARELIDKERGQLDQFARQMLAQQQQQQAQAAAGQQQQQVNGKKGREEGGGGVD